MKEAVNPFNVPLHNRAQRRAAAKAERKKTRPVKPHSRRRLLNVIEYAGEGAQKVHPAEATRIMAPAVKAATNLRAGRGTYKDWQHICSWINILTAVNDRGVIRGMLPYIEQIEEATRAIYARAAGGDARTDERPAKWDTPTLYADELDACSLALDLARTVFRNLSLREYTDAYALAVARIRTERGIVEAAEELPMGGAGA